MKFMLEFEEFLWGQGLNAQLEASTKIFETGCSHLKFLFLCNRNIPY